MFRFRELIKMKCLSFLFQQKRNSKIGVCGDLALSVLYSTKTKIIPSLLSCYLKILARLNGILEKLILRETRNKVFRCSTSLFEISLFIYLIFLHYSSGFIDSLYVNILCLNCDCDHDSSYVDVAYVLSIFGQFWKSNYIYKFLPIQDACVNFSEWSNNENDCCFCKGLEGRFG